MAALENPGRPLTVEANMGLVRQQAWQFRWACGTVLEESDLMQAGAIGLMRALETYDPEIGALSTYAKPWIRVAIGEAINRGRRTVRVPTKAEAKAWRKGTSYPLDIMQLDAPIFSHLELDGGNLAWVDVLKADDDPTAPLDARQRNEALTEALRRLPPRLRIMVQARFVDGLTLREIGEQHGFGRERARQLVGRGVRSMRKSMEEIEMGSVKRRVKKQVTRHLRLVKGGKFEAKATETAPLGAYLGTCFEARHDYELDVVACCKTCHAKDDFSTVEDRHGYFQVCCTVRQSLCPGDGPQHPAA